MKNYDDLQRFKEKTQTLDIDFKDMSGQAQDVGHSQWAIMRQLASDDAPELGRGQRIDLPQPQPIRGDEFMASAVAAPAAAPAVTVVPPLPAAAMPPIASVTHVAPQTATALFPPPVSAPAVTAVPPLPAAAVPPVASVTHVAPQTATALFPPPVSAPAVTAAPPPLAAATPAPQPTTAPAPSRFGALFRSRTAEPAPLSKDTPLKPLLEKIALCR